MERGGYWVALSVKLQAIMIVPVLLVYSVRRLGIALPLRLAVVAALVWGAVVSPVFAPGRGHGVAPIIC